MFSSIVSGMFWFLFVTFDWIWNRQKGPKGKCKFDEIRNYWTNTQLFKCLSKRRLRDSRYFHATSPAKILLFRVIIGSICTFFKRLKQDLSCISSQGRVCANPCPPGTYGVHCKERCDCYNGALCDHVNGKCRCLPGFEGSKVNRLQMIDWEI